MAARIGEREFAVLLEGPTTSDNATARAQQLIAKGLQHSEALPPTVMLKYQIVVALLPEGERDAASTLKWLREAVLAVPADNKRAIRPLNF
jgi:two-component system, sensor histidine kinase LadS